MLLGNKLSESELHLIELPNVKLVYYNIVSYMSICHQLNNSKHTASGIPILNSGAVVLNNNLLFSWNLA